MTQATETVPVYAQHDWYPHDLAITDTFYFHAVAPGQIQKTALQNSGKKATKPILVSHTSMLNF